MKTRKNLNVPIVDWPEIVAGAILLHVCLAYVGPSHFPLLIWLMIVLAVMVPVTAWSTTRRIRRQQRDNTPL